MTHVSVTTTLVSGKKSTLSGFGVYFDGKQLRQALAGETNCPLPLCKPSTLSDALKCLLLVSIPVVQAHLSVLNPVSIFSKHLLPRSKTQKPATCIPRMVFPFALECIGKGFIVTCTKCKAWNLKGEHYVTSKSLWVPSSA